MDVDIEKYIHTEFKDIIFNKINELGFERLRPLKDALPEEVTYFDIRYFIAEYKKCLDDNV